jgi:hypothetical protein
MDDEFGGTAPKHRYFDTIYHISGIRHGLRTIGRRPWLAHKRCAVHGCYSCPDRKEE